MLTEQIRRYFRLNLLPDSQRKAEIEQKIERLYADHGPNPPEVKINGCFKSVCALERKHTLVWDAPGPDGRRHTYHYE